MIFGFPLWAAGALVAIGLLTIAAVAPAREDIEPATVRLPPVELANPHSHRDPDGARARWRDTPRWAACAGSITALVARSRAAATADATAPPGVETAITVGEAAAPPGPVDVAAVPPPRLDPAPPDGWGADGWATAPRGWWLPPDAADRHVALPGTACGGWRA